MNTKTAAQAAPKRLGRPELPPDEAKTETVLVRMTKQQREKYQALGGPEWMRQQIERAKLPA